MSRDPALLKLLHMRRGLRLAASLLACASPLAQPAVAQRLTVQDYMKFSVTPADHRIHYGAGPLQFGDLRLPKGAGPHPVVIVIHGGCWLSRYDLEPVGGLCAALTRKGAATWSLEYRRIGDSGGGWPGTFEDVARGADHLRALARSYPLDLNRVVVIGHSAGGQLALWLAGRHRLPKQSAFYSPDPLRLHGVVSLAGIADMRRFLSENPNACGGALRQLLGDSETEVADRTRQISPIELLPLGVPQRLFFGAFDQLVPPASGREYESRAKKSGDDVRVIVLEQSGHFEMVATQASEWPTVENEVLSLLKPRKPSR